MESSLRELYVDMMSLIEAAEAEIREQDAYSDAIRSPIPGQSDR